MSRAWRWFLPGYVACLPLALIAIGYAFWRGAHSWRWHDGCLTFVSSRLVGNPGGQCWSPVIGFASEDERARKDLQVHERTHVVQSMLIQIAAFGLLWLWSTGDIGWHLSPAGVSLSVVDAIWLLASSMPFAVAYGAGFARHHVPKVWREAGLSWSRIKAVDWRPAYRLNQFEIHAYAVQSRYVAAPAIDKIRAWGHR